MKHALSVITILIFSAGLILVLGLATLTFITISTFTQIKEITTA